MKTLLVNWQQVQLCWCIAQNLNWWHSVMLCSCWTRSMYQFEMIVGQAVPFIVSFIYANSPVISGPKIPVELSSSRVPTLPVPYWMLLPTTPSGGSAAPTWHFQALLASNMVGTLELGWIHRWRHCLDTIDLPCGVCAMVLFRSAVWKFFCTGEASEQLSW